LLFILKQILQAAHKRPLRSNSNDGASQGKLLRHFIIHLDISLELKMMFYGEDGNDDDAG